MSYNRSVELICDGCGGSEFFPLENEVGHARRESRKDGWVTRLGGRDYCPDCRPTPGGEQSNTGGE
jgi:hypothetical protein